MRIEPRTQQEFEYHYNIAAGIAAFVYWFRQDYGGPLWLVKHHHPNRKERRRQAALSRRRRK